MVDKILRQKVISSKRPICLPYGMSICKLLKSLDFLTLGLQVLPLAENSLNHVSLLRVHFCHHQGIWVRVATLTKLQIASASKETMTVALGSSPPTLTNSTAAASTTTVAATTAIVVAATTTTVPAVAIIAEAAAATTVVVTAATAPVQDVLEDQVDAVIA